MEKIGDILVLHAMEGQDLQRSHVCASLQRHEMMNKQRGGRVEVRSELSSGRGRRA